jgi:hypothetical protein
MKRQWRSRYKQGKFNLNPNEKLKYNGTYPIIYRSSYEYKFLLWVTNNPNIKNWSSESIVVPYRKPTDNKVHRYFLDFSVELTNGKKYIIEIKPLSQTKPPVRGRKQQRTFLKESITYKINNAKWTAAIQWANKNGYEFKIITEKELGIKNK